MTFLIGFLFCATSLSNSSINKAFSPRFVVASTSERQFIWIFSMSLIEGNSSFLALDFVQNLLAFFLSFSIM